MSEIAYLKLMDKKSGSQVKGGCIEKKFKGMIEVQAYEHTITVPTHRQTGAATGETMHGPIVLVKPMCQASPLLQLALAEHHEMEGQIDFYRTRDGKRKFWYTIKFTDARIIEIRNVKEPAWNGGDKPDYEAIQFRYRTIAWEHKGANKKAKVDWLEK